MSKSNIKISKFLSYVLRHKPEAIGLEIDANGWASISELMEKADFEFTLSELKDIVITNDKQRFVISDDGLFIRANQGHSIEVNLELKSVEPPEYLYHGTATRFAESIRQEGLISKTRQFVHLSMDHDTAVNVGQRHGKPVVLKVAALKMHKSGCHLFRAENGVWLTKEVRPEFLLDR